MRSIEIASVEGTDFTDLLTQGAVETETMPGLRADGIGNIKNISILSIDNYAWTVEMYGAAGGIISKQVFAVEDGVKINVAGTDYYAYGKEVSWAVPFDKSTLTVTFGVRNMSADAKTGNLVLVIEVDKYNG